jgi:hypothetical protein
MMGGVFFVVVGYLGVEMKILGAWKLSSLSKASQRNPSPSQA